MAFAVMQRASREPATQKAAARSLCALALLIGAFAAIGPEAAWSAPRDKAGRSERAPRQLPSEPPDKAPAVTPDRALDERAAPLASPAQPQVEDVPAASPPPAAPPPPPHESVDADVSVRSVAVTSAFTGTEVVLFGAINNARPQTSRTDGYDIVIVFEGSPTSVLVRRKSNIGGIWLNSSALQLDRLPSYYAIASTRPLSEIAVPEKLKAYRIGLGYVEAEEEPRHAKLMSKDQIAAFKVAAIEQKRKEGLYDEADYGVSFIGRSLFRSSIQLPANVPVGPLTARVYLFRSGDVVAQSPARVMLSRKGIERSLYSFAFDHPLFYGLTAVAIAIASGLLASAVFGRRAG